MINRALEEIREAGRCLFASCRISEALALQKNDVKNKTITFRKSTTKGKLKTRN